ncbi:SLATT domain-containing protein [bacterium]|nr:SLATT domain-containing protein [bacterium]
MGSQSVKDNAKKEESKGPVPVTYNTNLERLLKENSEECESLSILHRMSYEKYNTRSNYINIPVIILSSAIGFITGIDLQYDKMNIILGVGSVFVGIIKSVDTYFQLAKRAESHRICSLQFSQISKKMQVELTLHRNQRMTAENMMNIIKTDIKNMQDIAPLIDDDIINIYNAKYRKYKRVKKPNFVNGLTDVVVNSNNNEYEYEYSSRHGSREGSPANAQVAPQTSQSHDKEYEHQLESQGVNNTSVSKMNDATANSSNHVDDDNESVEPIQPTIIPTTRSNASLKSGSVSGINSIRKSAGAGADLSVPVMAVAETGRDLFQQQQQQQNPLELLQLLNKLQQGIASNVVGPNLPPQSSHPSQSPQPHAVAVEINDVIIPIDIDDVNIVPSVSPTGSIRSNSSLPLGSIQTDNSGNQIVNT